MKLLAPATSLEEYSLLSDPMPLANQNGHYIACVTTQEGKRGVLIYRQGRRIAFLNADEATTASTFITKELPKHR